MCFFNLDHWDSRNLLERAAIIGSPGIVDLRQSPLGAIREDVSTASRDPLMQRFLGGVVGNIGKVRVQQLLGRLGALDAGRFHDP